MAFPQPFYRWRPHPWHGLEVGPRPPEIVQAYIEITPFDPVKFEVDKVTGYLRVDRPQRTSSLPPALYGFIPRTYCGDRVGALSPEASRGDGDPLDICVLSDRPINRSDILVNARVIGGLQMVDGGEADDKIVAVLANDDMYAQARDLQDVPAILVERLHHYFSTYKHRLGETAEAVRITEMYGVAQAHAVIAASVEDYEENFGS